MVGIAGTLRQMECQRNRNVTQKLGNIIAANRTNIIAVQI
jgi:hypothetical protein